MNGDDRRESFLSRWSSRKRDVSANKNIVDEKTLTKPSPVLTPTEGGIAGVENTGNELVGAELVADSESVIPTSQDQVSEKPSHNLADVHQEEQEEPLLSDADMPPIESLTAESDVSGFFNKGVSAALRKAALRHVFRQPKFNIRDGLNDYDGDYTVFEPLGDTITSDMKFHAARKERDRLAAEAEREEELLRQQQLEAGAEVEEGREVEGDVSREVEGELEGEVVNDLDAPVENELEAGLESELESEANPKFERGSRGALENHLEDQIDNGPSRESEDEAESNSSSAALHHAQKTSTPGNAAPIDQPPSTESDVTKKPQTDVTADSNQAKDQKQLNPAESLEHV